MFGENRNYLDEAVTARTRDNSTAASSARARDNDKTSEQQGEIRAGKIIKRRK